jgi:hypothetical protein
MSDWQYGNCLPFCCTCNTVQFPTRCVLASWARALITLQPVHTQQPALSHVTSSALLARQAQHDLQLRARTQCICNDFMSAPLHCTMTCPNTVCGCFEPESKPTGGGAAQAALSTLSLTACWQLQALQHRQLKFPHAASCAAFCVAVHETTLGMWSAHIAAVNCQTLSDGPTLSEPVMTEVIHP